MMPNKRSSIILYSDPEDIYSHQVRFVLAEKQPSNAEVTHVTRESMPEDLKALNPYNSLPVLVDRRDLVLYEPQIIMEYLDERFPHPPLLPVYPVERAKHRLMIYRMKRDWYALMHKIQDNDCDESRALLSKSLVSLEPVFQNSDYFLGEFSLLDCCLGPLLWRLPELGVALPASATALHEYMERLFNRKSFQCYLSEEEVEMRDPLYA